MNWLRTYAATHAFWIIVAAIALFALREHDQKIKSMAEASQQEKASQQVISDLRSQMAQRAVQTEQAVAKVRTIVAKSTTPEQVVAAIPTLTDIPLHARPLPDQEVAVSSPDLIAYMGQCKTDAVELARCQADLQDEQKVGAQLTLEKEQWKKASKKHGLFGQIWQGTKNVAAIAGVAATLLVIARH